MHSQFESYYNITIEMPSFIALSSRIFLNQAHNIIPFANKLTCRQVDYY
jgi:hypothetical protein